MNTALVDNMIVEVLNNVNIIALVGASSKPDRDSYKVMAFLINQGYQVIPVNPLLKGTKIMGREVYASVGDIPLSIDMIDVFRQSKYLFDIVEEAKKANIPYLWAQLGVSDEKAEALALKSGIKMIVDRCPAIEIPRLKC